MKKALLVIIVLALFPRAGSASDVKEICSTFSGTDVTITTTAETVVATSEACTVPSPTFKAVVTGYAVVTTSANSATVTVRIRRQTVTGTALGDAIAETVKVTAGGVEPFVIFVTDERTADVNTVTYVMTLEIASATSTSTVGQAFIEVKLL